MRRCSPKHTARKKALLILALFPPATYVGLFAATPMPYSPVLDYVIDHSVQYGQAVSEGALLLETSQRTLHSDVTSFSSDTITAWTVPAPSADEARHP